MVETPQEQVLRTRKYAGVVLTVVAVLVVSCALCGFAGWPYAKFLFFPGGFCSDEDARFLRQLAGEPLVTTAPPDFIRLDQYAFQPCEGNGDSFYYGAVGTWWTFRPTAPDTTTVIHFYQRLALDSNWRIDNCPDKILLCANKDIDETSVSFSLSPRVDKSGQPGYVAELTYDELGQ